MSYSIKQFKCPFCAEATENFAHESKFIRHLSQCHNIHITDPKQFEQLYIDTFLNGIRPTCKCGCGAPVKFYSWKLGFMTPYLRGHNALAQGNFTSPDKVKQNIEKRREGYKTGRLKIWNKGQIKPKNSTPELIEVTQDVQEQVKCVLSPTDIGDIDSVVIDGTVHEQIQHKTMLKLDKLYNTNEQLAIEDKNVAVGEIAEYILSLGFSVRRDVVDVIPGHTIDIYVPEKNFAIDYTNFYLRCEPRLKNKNFFQERYDAVQRAGIGIFMMYEDEWRDKQELICAMIRHRLGLSKSVYHGRKLELRKLTVRERQIALDSSHLEGDVNSRAAFGLVTPEGEVVAAMSVRRAFHKRYKEFYEIGRSACRPDTVVHGWIGRLVKACYEFAISEGKQGLVTYVDSRVGNGGAYITAGFELTKDSTGPRLWWTDYHGKFNRFQYKADLPNGKSQAQVCDEAGVVALFGMGNKLLKMEKCR